MLQKRWIFRLQFLPRGPGLVAAASIALALALACHPTESPPEVPGSGVGVPADVSPFADDLSGMWQVRVEDLDEMAPIESLDKTVGLVFWRFSVEDQRFALRQYRPHADQLTAAEAPLAEASFHTVPIDKVEVLDSSVAFEGPAGEDFRERFELDRFAVGRIEGSYQITPSAADGSQESYAGRLILERQDERDTETPEESSTDPSSETPTEDSAP